MANPAVIGGGILVLIIIIVVILWATGVLGSKKKEVEEEKKKEGEECEGPDPNTKYKIDASGECVIDSCIEGYVKEDNLCVLYTPKVQDTPETMRSASSVHSGQAIGVGHGRGRLDSPQGWSAQKKVIGEWYQLDAGSSKKIRGVAIMGRVHVPGKSWSPQYVKTFKVQSSSDGTTWDDVENGKIFTGNTDATTQVDVTFDTPVDARYIRIYPQTWNKHMSMRTDIIVDVASE
jgi:hypothetical protein